MGFSAALLVLWYSFACHGNLYTMNFSEARKPTRQVKVGRVAIGGGAPVVVQSMTNTKTHMVDETVAQIRALRAAGCEIVRVSVPDPASAAAIPAIKAAIDIPLVADIHFQADLAVAAIKAGADKVRINPGNIGGRDETAKVVEAAAKASVPIRIGVNSGSLSKEIRATDAPPAEKLARSAIENIELIEGLGFNDIVVSVKSSSVTETVEAYRLLSEETDHPLHLGVTESGTLESGAIKSAIGIGILLAEGIGDTIRVSLTSDPVHEIETARQILQALDIRRFSPEIISCPTCARCEVELIPIAEQLEKHLKSSTKIVKVAVMGCVVNGPGEAADADIGLAAGKGKGVIFSHGRAVKTVTESEFLSEMLRSIDEFEDE